MKKFIFTLFLSVGLMASAQLSVDSLGRVAVGSLAPSIGVAVDSISLYSGNLNEDSSIDKNASLVVGGKNFLDNKACLSFGSGKFVQMSRHGRAMKLTGYEGITFNNGSKDIFKYTRGGDFNISVPLKASAFITEGSPEQCLDYEVLDINQGVSAGLSQLQAVRYVAEGDDYYRERYTIDAGALESVYPSLVIENGDGSRDVDLVSLIPLLVDRVNYLESMLEQQGIQVNSITNSGDRQNRASKPGMSADKAEVCKMMQNDPNPFNVSTTIALEIPSNIATAQLRIYNLEGRQLKNINIAERGATAVTIEASALQPGMYIYSLIADGKEVATKRMILTD